MHVKAIDSSFVNLFEKHGAAMPLSIMARSTSNGTETTLGDDTRDERGVQSSSAALVKLVNEEMIDWSDVLDQIRSHPEELLDVNEDGMNSLHAVCYRHADATIVRAILESAPKVARQTRISTGELPLHVASYTCSEEVQLLILESFPHAAKVQDNYGDCPLHYAMRHGASLHLLERLLDAAPEVISCKNKLGMTPFSEICCSFLEADSLEEILGIDGEAKDELDEEDEDARLEWRQDWDVLVLFLKQSYLSRTRGTFRRNPLVEESMADWILHAAAATPSCPLPVLQFLCKLFPEQLRKRNEQGLTPLLLAAQVPREKNLERQSSSSSLQSAVTLLASCPKPIKVEPESEVQPRDPLEIDSREDESDSATSERTMALQGKSSVSILLDSDSGAAKIPDPDGNSPLCVALSSGNKSFCWANTIGPLFRAHPLAIQAPEVGSGLPMFLIAAIYSPSLDVIYEITRMDPQFCCLTTNVCQELDFQQEQLKLQQETEDDNTTCKDRFQRRRTSKKFERAEK